MASVYLVEVELEPKVGSGMGGEHFPNGSCLKGTAQNAVQEITDLAMQVHVSRCLLARSQVLQSLPEKSLATPRCHLGHHEPALELGFQILIEMAQVSYIDSLGMQKVTEFL